MKRLVLYLALGILCAFPAPVMAGPTYTGSLATDGSGDGLLSGTGAWVASSSPTTLNWTVTQNDNLSWNYSYTLSVPIGAISHVIVEVSDSFTLSDILDDISGGFLGPDLDTYDKDNGNPGMPGSMKGIKYEDLPDPFSLELLALTWNFDSTRVPVWGDFYAKDGQAGQQGLNVVWNAGFALDDPTVGPNNGTVDNHILRPDTTVVPAPGAILLGSIGIGLVGWMRRKKVL